MSMTQDQLVEQFKGMYDRAMTKRLEESALSRMAMKYPGLDMTLIHPDVVEVVETGGGVGDPLDRCVTIRLTGDRYIRVPLHDIQGRTVQDTMLYLARLVEKEVGTTGPYTISAPSTPSPFFSGYGIPPVVAVPPLPQHIVDSFLVMPPIMAKVRELMKQQMPTAYMDEHLLCTHDGRTIQKRDCKLHWEELESENSLPLMNDVPPKPNFKPPAPTKPGRSAPAAPIRKTRTARRASKPRAPSTSASAPTSRTEWR